MKDTILLIRTYVSVGLGGPVPPLDLLYTASQLHDEFNQSFTIQIIDMGIGDLTPNDIRQKIKATNPKHIVLHAMAWEAETVHHVASLIKDTNKRTTVMVSGQLADLAKNYLSRDPNIDFIIIGEPELTILELIRALETHSDTSSIAGLFYQTDGMPQETKKRIYPADLDILTISGSAWDMIDLKAYSRYASWNGATKEEFYIPILTSRGCPFPCTFCLETYDKQFRARTPHNVINEIKFLQDKYKVKEIHVFDAVFNYNNQRAKEICRAIIDSGVKVSLAFPHGIRADIMTDELITLLKAAGTYKLVYGIESGSHRIQKMIKKNLHLPHVKDIIRKTADTGILTGGYFILGFDGETEDEMNQTIDFAARSNLDIASFFKATEYSDIINIYQNRRGTQPNTPHENLDFADISYYSVKRSMAQISARKLNELLLKAQYRFYLDPQRIFRVFLKYPSKLKYIRNFLTALSILLQAYLIHNLQPAKGEERLN